MERKLASVVVIDDLQPIEGADLIEVATVKGWKLVVKKQEFNIGDPAVYCEIDSFLPEKEVFEFLRRTSFRTMAGIPGFRLKTMRMRGQISQGLLLPISVLNGDAYTLGEDVSEKLGIVKYEPPVPAALAGVAKGNFPSFIPKTDEERVQNLSGIYERLKNTIFYITEKLDGSSATFYHRDGEFGVCSRNLDLMETADNTFWKIAHQLDLPAKLAAVGKNIALQGELIGEGIQSNPYCIKAQTVRFFNVFDIDAYAYLPLDAFREMITQLELEHVPILDTAFMLPDTIDELLLAAEGASALSPAGRPVEREGIVIRSIDRSISFKAISNKFLLNER
ncbi:RNA ligase (ATP) [Chitinophaga qingshengii]|uniref:RNA ligase (ATP) n=1 Tax=Chitinophaga qingshengii TaxID=1569794 RepID=A0ABR7TX66_9BACT|nr:RNA ligase (ATP) [Chitinophaga qingshengii]MBC9935059.1 RNA ligase (ATP) [Chitinophaga qingshengii]